MSDLKHQSIPELRRRLASVTRYRQSQLMGAEMREGEAQELLTAAAECRRRYHNAGQQEVWIRKYLAEKEIAS